MHSDWLLRLKVLPASNVLDFSREFSLTSRREKNYLLLTIHWIGIHLIEKTLSGEKHKPLTMRPKGFLGRCISSFAYSKYKPVPL